MKTKRLHHHCAGFTLIEFGIYATIAIVASAAVLSFVVSGLTLSTKNSNLNRSHDDLRLAFDRLAYHLSAANNVPTLINTSGTTVSGPVTAITTPVAGWRTGPAAGFKFDRIVGDTYLVQSNEPTSTATLAGSLTSSATTAPVWIARNGLTHIPNLRPESGTDVSSEGYVFILPLSNGSNLRLRINNVTANSTTTDREKLTFTFATPVGQTVTWAANQPQIAKVVRSEAFLVMPVDTPEGVKNELRYYRKFEPVPNLNDASKYVVLCDQIGTKATEGTPFYIVEYNGDRYVESTLRVRERATSGGTVSEVNSDFYTFFQLHVNLPSRLRPRTTN